MSFFWVRLEPPASNTIRCAPRLEKYKPQPAPTWIRNSETPSPTGSTSPIKPRSNRLILATTTPRTAASVRPSNQEVNSGRGLIENTECIVIVRLQFVKRGEKICWQFSSRGPYTPQLRGLRLRTDGRKIVDVIRQIGSLPADAAGAHH